MGGACSRKRDQNTVEADDGQSSRSGRLSRSVSLRWPVKPPQALETLAVGAHRARAPPTLLEICVREIVKVIPHLHSLQHSFLGMAGQKHQGSTILINSDLMEIVNIVYEMA